MGRKKKRLKKTTDSNHPDPIAPNVLERNFNVELPNTVVVAVRDMKDRLLTMLQDDAHLPALE